MSTDILKQIERLEKHQENTAENIKHAVDRFDILVISLSSGGIALEISSIKDILEIHPLADLYLLKGSLMLFGGAIILNLFSQVTSCFANKLELACTKNDIRIKKNKPIIGNQQMLNNRAQILSKSTDVINGASLLSLILAMVSIGIFIYNKV